MASVVWPSILNGVSVSFIFVPLTTATMGHLQQQQIGNASGIFNLMRNLGGGVGISMATTLLARGAQTHQATLVRHVNPYDPQFHHYGSVLGQLFGEEGGMISPRGLAMLYRLVLREANLASFMDAFRLMAILTLLCVPAVLLFRGVRAKAGPVAAH
jgi:DHA2 family multidrug resistance protein